MESQQMKQLKLNSVSIPKISRNLIKKSLHKSIADKHIKSWLLNKFGNGSNYDGPEGKLSITPNLQDRQGREIIFSSLNF